MNRSIECALVLCKYLPLSTLVAYFRAYRPCRGDGRQGLQQATALWAETFKEVAAKPRVGTFRVADSQANPGMLVEVE